MLGPAPAAVRDLNTDGVPDMDERGVIAGLLEQGERCQRQPLELVRRAFAEIRAVVRRHRTGERFAGRIALGGGALGRVFKVQRGLTSVVDEGGLGQVDLEQDVEPQGPRQVQGSLEENRRRPAVFPPERAAAGGGEPVSCPCSQVVRRLSRALGDSERLARGGSRRSRPARPVRRAPPASRRSARAARPASLLGRAS